MVASKFGRLPAGCSLIHVTTTRNPATDFNHRETHTCIGDEDRFQAVNMSYITLIPTCHTLKVVDIRSMG